jgi:hypothetical protein
MHHLKHGPLPLLIRIVGCHAVAAVLRPYSLLLLLLL